MNYKIIKKIALIIYLLVLTWGIIFKFNTIDGDMRFGVRSLNLIPFESLIGINFNEFLIEVILNIFLFIPLGILICLFNNKRTFLKALLYGLTISVTYEMFQFVFGFGSADITDVVMNVSGVIFGVILYNLILYKIKQKTVNIILIVFIIIGVVLLIYGGIKTANAFNDYMQFVNERGWR